jgi:hypothetical protein
MAAVVDLDGVRIARALRQRRRYRYMRPRVAREGAGWLVLSPNCSRSVDRAGGEIRIAWLVPETDGRWCLHARDHAQDRWVLKAAGLALAEALSQLCIDPQREFWQ